MLCVGDFCFESKIRNISLKYSPVTTGKSREINITPKFIVEIQQVFLRICGFKFFICMCYCHRKVIMCNISKYVLKLFLNLNQFFTDTLTKFFTCVHCYIFLYAFSFVNALNWFYIEPFYIEIMESKSYCYIKVVVLSENVWVLKRIFRFGMTVREK